MSSFRTEDKTFVNEQNEILLQAILSKASNYWCGVKYEKEHSQQITAWKASGIPLPINEDEWFGNWFAVSVV